MFLPEKGHWVRVFVGGGGGIESGVILGTLRFAKILRGSSIDEENQHVYITAQLFHKEDLTAIYSKKRRTDLSHFVNFTVNFNSSVKIRLVATCDLETCYNLLEKLAADNKF